MKTWEEITSLMWFRRQADSYLLRKMVETRDRYNGDVIIPLPDVATEPTLGSLTPQLVADGIDHNAMRAASVIPTISCPAVANQVRAKEAAADRRRALYANWHYCGMELILYRFYRHFIGYGTAAMVAVPDFIDERARVELRDPLTSYPELRTPEDFRPPLNVGFVFGRSEDWIFSRYPEAKQQLKMAGADVLWDIVEWIDEDDIVVGVLGPRSVNYRNDDRYYTSTPSANSMELRRWPNRAGQVPAAVPRRATLDRIMGQLVHVYPTIDLMERLTALEVIAAERHTFPDMVIMGKRTAMPSVQGGRWKDGREGEPNIVIDADGIQLLNPTSARSTMDTINMLERSARTSGGVVTEFGGEPGNNALRTGNAIDRMMGFSVDPRIMEAQKFGQRALETINQATMAIEKGYWPSKKYTVFSGWAGDSELIEYTPAKAFQSLHNSVIYAMPGTDISQMTVALSQLNGAGLMSKHSARNKHPFIDDSNLESKHIVEERIEDAMLLTFLQQASTGSLPLIDLANINETYQKSGSMIEAVRTADAIARARQAQQVQPQAPEAQPGLAPPGQGAEAATAPPAGGGPQNMQAVLQALQGTPEQVQTRIGSSGR